ncbi:MAG TPA: hypothetical protein PLH27_10730 [bacterium]|nr:hypothetical protein [bacterium]
MNKQDIVAAYRAASNSEKYAITSEVLQWLKEKQITVSRQALHYWRNSTGDRTPLDAFYMKAHTEALKLVTAAKSAAQN